MAQPNKTQYYRLSNNWSQAQLAKLAGISRAAVSAIEQNRLVPSVATALSLAGVFKCSVEELFANNDAASPIEWAWQPATISARYWQAIVGKRQLKFPIEANSTLLHDGMGDVPATAHESNDPQKTLVVASCDPAAGLLATEYQRMTGFRMVVLQRSSRKALELLKAGIVHVAGIHFATSDSPDGNAREVKQSLGQATHHLLRVAEWQEGLAVRHDAGQYSVAAALKAKFRWVGREPGSAARQCLEELAPHRPTPKRISFDHQGVAKAIQQSWADIGICHRLSAEEAGLQFIPVREEQFDLCYSTNTADDPRMKGLLQFIRSVRYRRPFGELPGIATRDAGETQLVG